MSDGGRGPYSKSDAVRARILEVGLAMFGELGFAATSTRLLAERAAVTLPALTYYFGSKEGLYRACAREVADRFIATTNAASALASDALHQHAEAAQVRAAFQQLMRSVVDAMTGTAHVSYGGSFALRELLEPGPGFDIMFERLWRPGIELCARLIARLHGRDAANEADIVDAQMLLASVSPFQIGANVAKRVSGWDSIGPAEREMIKHRLVAHIERI